MSITIVGNYLHISYIQCPEHVRMSVLWHGLDLYELLSVNKCLVYDFFF